ncbi:MULTISPECIES: hypothetical protein [unclassified Aeromicrobium]|uniref:hypothetical protein n=1 Tax=unclassified Aeromicrobium TaxID=2633570 RepID=UPI00396B41C1
MEMTSAQKARARHLVNAAEEILAHNGVDMRRAEIRRYAKEHVLQDRRTSDFLAAVQEFEPFHERSNDVPDPTGYLAASQRRYAASDRTV